MIDLLLALAVAAAPSPRPPLPAVHPRLYFAPDDVARARANVARFAWAKDYFAALEAEAGAWARKSDTELRAAVPPPGSTFAYGFSGCPECGANWPFWGAGGVASMDRPGTAACPACKRAYPDRDHPDEGRGWKNPRDGKTYYFVGVYNAYAAAQVTVRALDALSVAYAITRDRAYSHAAAVLFDALADVYPTAHEGSVDYPDAHNTGRLERPQYQVGRVIPMLSRYLDFLYDSPEFAAPAPGARTGIPVRQRVETSIIRDGGAYCYEMAAINAAGYQPGKTNYGLTNGQADFVRGALAAGIMLGETSWIETAVSGPFRLGNFLDNCLDGDGQYYETSIGYGDHALSVYADMAEILFHLRTPERPSGIDLYRHPKLQKALFEAAVDVDCMGHFPRFGDWAPDLSVTAGGASRYSALAHLRTEILWTRANGDAERARWAAARDFVCGGDVEARRSARDAADLQAWLLFHAEPLPKVRPAAFAAAPKPVLGGRGAAALRTGEGPAGTAAFIRYGLSANHGHLDDLNVNLFALGRELTYDLGYDLASSHVQTGWARLTASHNLVVVDEKNQMTAAGGGGRALLSVDSPPVRAFEASSEASYASEGVKTYRRTVALVDLAPGRSYVVDLFRVEGGRRHDQSWHFGGALESVDGADLGPVQEKGSLAGPEFEWGTKLGAGGDLAGCADRGPYWNAPPGNGYGFLNLIRKWGRTAIADSRQSKVGADLCLLRPDPNCMAVWALDSRSGARVRARFLLEPASEVVTAQAPGILPELPRADYLLLRRAGEDLKSAFATVIEPCADGSAEVLSASRLENDGGPDACAVGVAIRTKAGTDYVLSAMAAVPVTFRAPDGDIRFRGRFGFLRVTGGIVRQAVLAGGMEMTIGNQRLTAASDGFRAVIESVDDKRNSVRLRGGVPRDLDGAVVFIDRPGYSHNSPYRVVRADSDGTLTLGSDFVIARGFVGDARPDRPDAIANIVPFPKATTVARLPCGYFRGKLVRNERTGAVTTVLDVDADQRTVRVRDPGLFSRRDSFVILDVREGDEISVPSVVFSRSLPGQM